ncbi:MAG: hypothetical protein IKN63_05710 [Bacilli bacterium]|nr:hypothetical protein [Bacilli bacterium]
MLVRFVCEQDGNGLHLANEINLVRFLNGEESFFKDTAMRRIGLIYNEYTKILLEGIAFRILLGSDNLMIAITSKIDITEDF